VLVGTYATPENSTWYRHGNHGGKRHGTVEEVEPMQRDDANNKKPPAFALEKTVEVEIQ
jgi:hypothetical protein